MTAPEDPWDDLADAVLDGTAAGWAELESRSGTADPALLEQFRVVAAVRAVARSTEGSQGVAPRFWGHLRVLEPIGRGAFGEVYRAWDTRLDREVALKLLPPEHTASDPPPSIIEEGRLLARVRHPNVVTIYGAERIDDRVGLWMEFVRGHTLERTLQDGAVFSAHDIVRFGLELCGAVSAVHAAGLLHRDIKPNNVMVADDGRLVLMDFGTGSEMASASDASVAGTPLYLAPEVLAGAAPTAGSDIYSIGVLLYHLVTRAYPVRASTLQDLRRAHAEGEPPRLRSLRPDLPRSLTRVIERAVDPQPGRRYASPGALAADLAAAGTPARFARAPALAATTLAVVLVAWGGWWLLDRSGTDPAPSTALATGGSMAPSMLTGATPVLSLSGETFSLALSPDGKQVAFVWAPTYGSNLYVNRLGDEAVVQLTHTPGTAAFPAWSRDGRFIAFRHQLDDVQKMHAISVVSAAGGPSRQLWSGDLILARGLDWSPDGGYLVSSGRAPGTRQHRLLLLTVATGKIEWLTSPLEGSDDSYPVFSPDGRAVAFVRNAGTDPGIYLLRLDTRVPGRVMAAQSTLKRLAWSSAGQHLFFASEEGPGKDRLWKMSVPGGQVEPVSGTSAGASEPSIAKRGGRLVFLQSTLDRNLYRADVDGDSRQSIERLPGTIRSETHPDISPDGARLAFVSDRTGHSEIWTADARGADPRMVTSLKSVTRHPRWAPDGQRLAFVGLNAGSSNHDIYVVQGAGGGIRRLTDEPSTEQWPTWSRDGRWIYFTSDRTGIWQIWKVSDTGGLAVQVTTTGGLKVWESRDGKSVLYSDETRGIWRIQSAGARPERLLDFPHRPSWGGEWMPTDRGIVFLNMGASPQATLELFDFSTRRIARVITLSGLYDGGSGFAMSPDGTWFIYPQRDVARSEIMLMDVGR